MTTYQTEQDINAKKQVLKQYTNYSDDKIEELARTKSSIEITEIVFKMQGLMPYTPVKFNFAPPPTDANIMDIRSMYPKSLIYPESLIQQKDPYKEIVRPKN